MIELINYERNFSEILFKIRIKNNSKETWNSFDKTNGINLVVWFPSDDKTSKRRNYIFENFLPNESKEFDVYIERPEKMEESIVLFDIVKEDNFWLSQKIEKLKSKKINFNFQCLLKTKINLCYSLSKEDIFHDVCKKQLKYLPSEYPKIDKNSKKKSLIVETRWNNTVEFCIKNTIQKLGDGWGHIIFCNYDNYDKIKKLSFEISDQLEIINLGKSKIDRNSYNNLCLSLDFWNMINCQKVLIYQSDTYIFKGLDEKMFDYDYIGAAWGPSEHSKRLSNDFNFEKEICVGNGGLSLRSVDAIIEILTNHKPPENIHKKFNPKECDYLWEDVFFSHQMEISEKWKLGSVASSKLFSYENIYSDNSFGCHQPYGPDCQKNVFNKFLSKINGLNLYGFANNYSGLGQNMRNIIKAVEKNCIPYTLNVVNPVNNHISDYISDNENYFNTNLIMCNPDWDFLKNNENYLHGKYNIALWAWELEKIPKKWIETAKLFDEIWTISTFCKETFEKCLPDKIIKQLNLPGDFKNKIDKRESKKLIGFDNKFIILFTFDGYSDIERKNPEAVIESFKRSLMKNDDCVLIIKSHNLTNEELKLIGPNLSNKIILINEDWTVEKMEILFNATDIYVSLHRSEGSGLSLMEAIMLEIPIVTTGYSGNLDFCLSDYCQLVDYRMTEVSKNSLYFRMFDDESEKLFWSEPDIEDASNKLIEVYQNYENFSNNIRKNKEFVEVNYSTENLSKQISEFLPKNNF